MSLYGPKQLADSMRTVRKNTITIAEDIPETQYDFRPTLDSGSVRETLLHIASKMLFDIHIHEKEKLLHRRNYRANVLDLVPASQDWARRGVFFEHANRCV